MRVIAGRRSNGDRRRGGARARRLSVCLGALGAAAALLLLAAGSAGSTDRARSVLAAGRGMPIEQLAPAGGRPGRDRGVVRRGGGRRRALHRDQRQARLALLHRQRGRQQGRRPGRDRRPLRVREDRGDRLRARLRQRQEPVRRLAGHQGLHRQRLELEPGPGPRRGVPAAVRRVRRDADREPDRRRDPRHQRPGRPVRPGHRLPRRGGGAGHGAPPRSRASAPPSSSSTAPATRTAPAAGPS